MFRRFHDLARSVQKGSQPFAAPTSLNLSINARRSIAVALGFSAFIAVSLLAAYLLGLHPTQNQDCQRLCAASGKTGLLVYKGPLSSKPRNSSYDVFSECQCRQ